MGSGVLQGDEFVSTHSRPKAAGLMQISCLQGRKVSTHSRPKAAGTDAPKLGFVM